MKTKRVTKAQRDEYWHNQNFNTLFRKVNDRLAPHHSEDECIQIMGLLCQRRNRAGRETHD
jgi:hypothetical protein